MWNKYCRAGTGHRWQYGAMRTACRTCHDVTSHYNTKICLLWRRANLVSDLSNSSCVSESSVTIRPPTRGHIPKISNLEHDRCTNPFLYHRGMSWAGKGGRWVGLITLPPSCADFLQIPVSIILLETSGLSRPVMGVAVSYMLHNQTNPMLFPQAPALRRTCLMAGHNI